MKDNFRYFRINKNMDEKINFKNVKMRENIHLQIKKMSNETGINVGKIVEMGALKILEDYQSGEFDKLVEHNGKRLRRDGTLTRT
jgi:hypothetical protein